MKNNFMEEKQKKTSPDLAVIMDMMDIVEFNGRCADFLGWLHYTLSGHEVVKGLSQRDKNWIKENTNLDPGRDICGLWVTECEFHNSWDWINLLYSRIMELPTIHVRGRCYNGVALTNAKRDLTNAINSADKKVAVQGITKFFNFCNFTNRMYQDITKDEIKDYNKRCAEFLGWELFEAKSANHWESTLQFHTSWNFIMKVVDAIESTYDSFGGNFGVYIYPNLCTIESTNLRLDTENPRYNYYNHCMGEFRKEVVVNAINQFLIWKADDTERNKRL
jgi:PAS domain-containing protein